MRLFLTELTPLVSLYIIHNFSFQPAMIEHSWSGYNKLNAGSNMEFVNIN